MSDVVTSGIGKKRYIALTVAVVAASIGWIAGHSMPVVAWSINHQVFADNRTTTTICLVLAGFYITHYDKKPGHQRRRFIGLTLLCISMAAHREVWAWWRWHLGHGDKASADWIRDDLAWVTSIAQLGIWVAFGLILSAFVARYYETRGDWMVAAGIIGCWSFWFLISAGTA